MDLNWMMAVAILLPLVSGILIFIIRQYHIRGLIVILTAVALMVNSVFLLLHGPGSFSPTASYWGTIVTVLDYAMLLFYIYAGLSLKNWLVLIFALTQIVPLAYWEFGMGASKIIEKVAPTFYFDYLSLIMVVIISVIGSLICIFGIRYMYDHEHHYHIEKSRQPRFFFWLVIFLGGMNGLVMANNLVWLYFFWEVTTLCCFQLIAHDLTKEAINNGARALWMNSIGGTSMIIAMIIFFTKVGGPDSLSMQVIINGGAKSALLLLPVALMCFTGMIKAAQFPFQGWLLGAMVAPTPVSALLHSSTMVKAGVYLVLRLAPAFLGTYLGTMIAICGAFTFFAASGLAMSQTTGKRVLAYSTIANLGLIVACAGINTPLSIAAAILLIIFHAITKGLLFMCAGTIEQEIGSREIEDMEGLVAKYPVTTFISAIGMLAMFLPPFGMLLGKWMALEAVAQQHVLVIAAILFVLASAATMVFWAKWLGRLLQAIPHVKPKWESLSLSYWVPLWTLVVGIFVAGFGVGPIFQKCIQAAVGGVVKVANDSAQVVVAQVFNISLSNPAAVSTASQAALGTFPVWPLYVVLAVALLLPLVFVGIKPQEIRPVYLCGENFGGSNTDEWLTTGDQKAKVELGGFYWKECLGEAVLNPWAYTIAIALLVIMFGVVLGGGLL